MPYLNRCSFIGNLTRDPELRLPSTDAKKALCVLHVAINRDSRDESGEKRTHTTFINDIEVWGATGEACAHFLTLGSMVLVEGRMEADRWHDKESGAKRTRMKVVAESVQFLRIKQTGDPSSDPIADHPVAPKPASSPQRPPRGRTIET